MALKREVASLDEIPEALRSLYVEKDGKHVLDLEGADDGGLKSALEKERKARAQFEQQLKDIKAKLGDTDPAKAREALKMLADLEDKAALGELPPGIMAKVDELVSKRTARMQGEYEEKLKKSGERERAHEVRLEELLIDNAIRAAAAKAGVRATAVEDAVLYGKTVWKLKDGKPVPMKGDEVQFGKDGKPMTVEEWIGERAADRAHWFEPSGGTGTTGAGTTGRRVGNVVTITREQARDPQAYRAAKAQAEKAGASVEIAAN